MYARVGGRARWPERGLGGPLKGPREAGRLLAGFVTPVLRLRFVAKGGRE
jgi:hypothetical protein